jgi:type IV secretion system protein TrbL
LADEGDVNLNCGFGDVSCAASESFLNSIYQSISNTLQDIAKGLGTFWVNTPTINLGDEHGKPSEVVQFIQDSLSWYSSAILVIAVIYGGTQMILQRSGKPLMDLVYALMKYVLISGAGLATCVLALRAGDGYSKWVIEKSTPHGSFGDSLTMLLGIGLAVPSSGIVMFVIIIGIIAILIAFVQIGLLIIRSAIAIMLVGTLSIAYSGTNMGWGKNWEQKHTVWLIAFLLYKPAASTIYAAAFRIMDSFGDQKGDPGQQMVYFTTGVVLMIGSLAALPALMRLITPQVAAAAGSSPMFAGAMGGAMASGAINGGMGFGKSSGGGGASSGAGGSGSGGGPSGAMSSGGGSSGGMGAGASSATSAGSAGASGSSSPSGSSSNYQPQQDGSSSQPSSGASAPSGAAGTGTSNSQNAGSSQVGSGPSGSK